MKQITLFIFLSLICWFTSNVIAEETQFRLWQTSSDNGGEFKAYLVKNNLASDKKVSIMVLTEAAFGQAVKRKEIIPRKVKLTKSSWMVLAKRFYDRNTVPLDSEGYVLWADFCTFGKANNGFTPLIQADYDAALAANKKSEPVEVVVSVPETVTQTTVKSPIPEKKPAPTVENQPAVIESQPTEATVEYSYRRNPEVRKYTPLKVVQFTGAMEPEPEVIVEEPETVIPQYENYSEWRGRPRDNRAQSQYRHAESFLRSYFHDIPIMVEIARCESEFENVQSNNTLSYGREKSFGFFQIHAPNWHDIAVRLGLPDYQTDAMQNVLMARHILDVQGFRAWQSTKHCWGPRVRN